MSSLRTFNSEKTLPTGPRLAQWFNGRFPLRFMKDKVTRWVEKKSPSSSCIRTIRGVHRTMSMRLNLSNPFEYAMALNSFEIATAHVIRRLLGPGDVFVDGGANIGVFTLLASRRVGPEGQVYAFEPHPDFRLRLQEHLYLNRCNNVRVIPKGCWEEAGTFILEYYDYGSGMKIVSGKPPEEGGPRRMKAETVRIVDVVDRPVKVLKLDVEGAELAALRGASPLFDDRPPHVIVELSRISSEEFDFTHEELVAWILDRGRWRAKVLRGVVIEPLRWKRLKPLLDTGEPVNIWFAPMGRKR